MQKAQVIEGHINLSTSTCSCNRSCRTKVTVQDEVREKHKLGTSPAQHVTHTAHLLFCKKIEITPHLAFAKTK